MLGEILIGLSIVSFIIVVIWGALLIHYKDKP